MRVVSLNTLGFRNLVPAEIELVRRLKDRPFMFIGVNGDDDRDVADKAARKSGMNWRSIWASHSAIFWV